MKIWQWILSLAWLVISLNLIANPIIDWFYESGAGWFRGLVGIVGLSSLLGWIFFASWLLYKDLTNPSNKGVN